MWWTEIRGVLPPIPTFISPDGTLDQDAERAAVRRVLDCGVHGVIVLGTSGEGPVLPTPLRAAVVEEAVDAANGTPVVVGCGGHTVASILDQIRDAAQRGATGALLLPPFYFRLAQEALGSICETIADESPIPLILYHIPSLTGNGFGVATVERLAEHPRIVGIKDSERDFAYHLTLRRRVSNDTFRVFQGAGPLLLPSVAAGSDDSICPVTALVPSWEQELRSRITTGDRAGAAEIGDRIARLADLLNLGDVPMPVNLKVIAALLGQGPARPHEPRLEPGENHRQELAAGLALLGLVVSAPTVGGVP